MNRKYDINFVKEVFNKNNYILLTTYYINTKQKLKYICPAGHKGEISLEKWLVGQRCKLCAFNRFSNINDVRNIVNSEGFTLLTNEYKSSKQKIYYKCDKCGGINSVIWSAWSRKKNKCVFCVSNKCKDNYLDVFIKHVELEGYKYIEGEYKSSRSRIKLLCPNGHVYISSWFNWFTNNSRCKKCSNNTSRVEKTLAVFLNNVVTQSDLFINDKTLIPPYELDIVIPSKKLAIEYCGIRWHSELFGKDSVYHLNKLVRCKEIGYRLVTIFEDEFLFNKDIVLSRLLSILGENNTNIVYARNCSIREISTNDAASFFNENHLQGYNGSSVKLGLFYKEEMVSAMTFSKPSISKGAKNSLISVWELNRFCSKINYQVVGGASKLLKYFERNYDWSEIFSYADRRWSVGDLYIKLGFNLNSITPPNYWYFSDRNKYKRIHRFNLRKNNNDDQTLTEWENRVLQGWNRIWDCGNLKYNKNKEKRNGGIRSRCN